MKAKDFDSRKFEQHVLDAEPGLSYPSYTFSWYHNGSGDYCTTVFNSFEPPPEGETGLWQDPRKIAPGAVVLFKCVYRGVYGAFILHKARPELKAPYEI